MSPQIDGMRVWADFIGLICSDFTPWIYPLAIIQATQEHPPQIGHLAADNREQFRVRAQGLGKGLRAWRGSGNGQLLQEAGRSWIFHKSNWKEKHQISCIHLVIGIEHPRYNSFRLR